MQRIEWDTIDLLKLDIEGAEIEFSRQTPDHVLRRIGQMTIEFHDFCGITPSSEVRRVLLRLQSLGFSHVRMSGHGHQDTWLINRDRLEILSAEILFTRYIIRNWNGAKRVVARQFNRQ